MTKEELTTMLNQANAENATLKKRVAELETENGQLAAKNAQGEAKNQQIRAELQQARKSAEESNAAFMQVSETIMQKDEEIKRLQAEASAAGAQAAPAEFQQQLDFYKALAEGNQGKIDELLSAVQSSCADHCPHRANPDACRNCGISKQVAAAGFTIQPTAAEGK